MDKKIKYLTISLLTLTFIIVICYVRYGVALTIGKESILPGIKVGSVAIGGLNKQQAQDKLLLLQQELRQVGVTLTYQGYTWPLDLSQVNLGIDIEETLQQALTLGRKGAIVERWKLRQQIVQQGYTMQPVIELDTNQLAEVVNALAGHLNVAPRDAMFAINEQDQVMVTPSQEGRQIDIELLAKRLQQEILVASDITLTLPVTSVSPEYSTADIQAMGITGLLASYTTKYDAQVVNRAYNIKVAANALDGLMVAPGEEVSFNEVVGPRSSEAGYKSAGVIVNNEMVDGLGGGVCQVSTTLYNAVLLAGLELVERYNHSLPISYVPVGQDATVVYGVLDFRFQNNTSSCLYLKTEVKANQLTIKIFGDTTDSPKVTVKSWVEKELEPQVIFQEDENLKKGQQVIKQQGSKGFIAKSERIFMQNGQMVKREKLPTSRYNSVNKIIAVGTAEPEPVVTPPDNMIFMPVTEQTDHSNARDNEEESVDKEMGNVE